jgi:probable HAF family extracellular repeat protein
MADLGTLGGHDNSGCGSGIFQFTNGEFVSYLGAYGINASGQVVGYSVTTDQSVHAFLYSDGVMTDLGALVGTTSEAYGINAGGQVVGNSDAADGYREHAFVCLGGVMSDLGALDGYFGDSFAAGINDSGQVVGWSTTANDLSDHAFLYSSGVMSDLGALPGGGWSEAYGINASGQVVGWSTTAVAYANHAFLYSNGVMIDLNSLLPANSDWELVYAQAINDSGQIVGLAIVNGSQYHGFLLTQAPNLTSLSPSSAAAGGAAFTLTVAGANFIPGVTVGWNGTALETSYVSGTQLTASVPASEIAITGTASVTVTTTAGTTGAATFAIHPPRRLGLPGEPERRRQPAPREQQ